MSDDLNFDHPQEWYCGFVENIDRLLELHKQQNKHLEELKRGIMQKSMTSTACGLTEVKFSMEDTATLARAVDRAKKKELEQFEAFGTTFLTKYAEYLVEFLIGHFNLTVRLDKVSGYRTLYDPRSGGMPGLGRMLMPNPLREKSSS